MKDFFSPLYSPIEPNDIRSRVARGARFLDEWEPEWASRISVDALAMEACDRCVLGQLFAGDYSRGLRDLFSAEELDEDLEIDFGFERNVYADDAGFEDDEYAELAEAWRAEVRARLGGTP